MTQTTVKTLDEIFDETIGQLGGPATMVSGGAGDVYMEIMNTQDLSVWMCLEPITEEQYQSVSPAAPWMQSGHAKTCMDRAAFAHSPDKPEEFSQTECSGFVFRHVATPQNVDPTIYQSTGPKKVLVNKHHILGYEAGREVTVMDLDGEIFIEMIGTSKNDAGRELPDGAKLRTVNLKSPIIIHLPTPTTTYFWFGEGRSFQGPVDVPELRA